MPFRGRVQNWEQPSTLGPSAWAVEHGHHFVVASKKSAAPHHHHHQSAATNAGRAASVQQGEEQRLHYIKKAVGKLLSYLLSRKSILSACCSGLPGGCTLQCVLGNVVTFSLQPYFSSSPQTFTGQAPQVLLSFPSPATFPKVAKKLTRP